MPRQTKIFNSTNTEVVPRIMTGFRPYRSATTPQKTEVKALPNINEDPARKQKTKGNFCSTF